jgi:hypothetical protein
LKNKATNLLKTQRSVPQSDKTIPISDTPQVSRLEVKGMRMQGFKIEASGAIFAEQSRQVV